MLKLNFKQYYKQRALMLFLDASYLRKEQNLLYTIEPKKSSANVTCQETLDATQEIGVWPVTQNITVKT